MENLENNQNNEELNQQPESDAVNDENISVADAQTKKAESEYIPAYNPITVDEIKTSNDNKKSIAGLKIFALIMAITIMLSGVCAVGYQIGKSQSTSKPRVNVNLAAKPKDSDELTSAEVYAKVSDSIVGIIVYNEKGSVSYASGVIYSEDGYLITNDHIYENIAAPKFKIYTQDGREYDAKYVAGDTVSDIAVLKIDGKGFKAATFGNSDELNYGENVVAIGRPNEPTDKSSITKGVISAVNRRVRTTSNYTARLIQTDSPINPGSSGGALVNMYGQIIGITASKLVSESQESVGYAIPSTTMKYIADELIKDGKITSRAKLGITYVAVNSIMVELGQYKYVGLRVESVEKDSDLFNKLENGDTIISINGVDVTDDSTVLDYLEECRAGDKITVTFITESGSTETLSAVLRANVSKSSYNADINSLTQEQTPNKEFNFPEGE